MRTLFVSLTLLSLAWPLAAAEVPITGPGMSPAMTQGLPPAQAPTAEAMAEDADAEGEDGEDDGNDESAVPTGDTPPDPGAAQKM